MSERTRQHPPMPGAALGETVDIVLPVGWRDRSLGAGAEAVRRVTLRASRVEDEIRSLEDFRVLLRPESFLKVVLTRVIVAFGDRARVDVGFLERLDPADLRALEDAYRELNGYVPDASLSTGASA